MSCLELELRWPGVHVPWNWRGWWDLGKRAVGPPWGPLKRVIRAALLRCCVCFLRGLSEGEGGESRGLVFRGYLPGAGGASRRVFVMYPQF